MRFESTDPPSADDESSTIEQDGHPGRGPNSYWPRRRTSVLDWLINGTRQERFLDIIFGEFCLRLRASGAAW
jgi:hypothetical protein